MLPMKIVIGARAPQALSLVALTAFQACLFVTECSTAPMDLTKLDAKSKTTKARTLLMWQPTIYSSFSFLQHKITKFTVVY